MTTLAKKAYVKIFIEALVVREYLIPLSKKDRLAKSPEELADEGDKYIELAKKNFLRDKNHFKEYRHPPEWIEEIELLSVDDKEEKHNLQKIFETLAGYSVHEDDGMPGFSLHYKQEKVARVFKQYSFFRYLERNGIAWKTILSKQLIPDDALLVIVRETLFIIEMKTQNVNGSVDEKLQTCDFKRKQYTKLVHSLGLKVEYVYVLDAWFKDPKYKDVLDYIHSVNCHYKFENIPLAWLGLPAGNAQAILTLS